MRRLISLAFAALLAIGTLGLSSNAAKAVVTWDYHDGQLFGATGVMVGGTEYNVVFGSGTCIAVFSGCDTPLTDFAFHTQADAILAAQALLDQVFLDTNTAPGSPAFDTSPTLTNICSLVPTICLAFVPYGVDGGSSLSIYAQNDTTEASDKVNPTTAGWDRTIDIGLPKDRVWAIFSPAVVPLPPALLLFLSGLVAFFGIARVGRRKAAAEA